MNWLFEKLAVYVIKQLQDSPVRHQLLTMAVEELYNAIGKDDVLQLNEKGEWMYAGKNMTKEELESISDQARSLLNSKLWNILQTDVKYQANKKMFTESTHIIHLESGKMLVYYADIIKSRLEKLAK